MLYSNIGNTEWRSCESNAIESNKKKGVAMFEDFRSCYRRLQFFDNLIEQIVQKIGTRNQIMEEEKDDIKRLLKELKNELKKDNEFLSNVDLQDTLSEIDKNFYYPAIQEALSKLGTKTSLAPRQKLVRKLYEAQDDIRRCMDGLYNYL